MLSAQSNAFAIGRFSRGTASPFIGVVRNGVHPIEDLLGATSARDITDLLQDWDDVIDRLNERLTERGNQPARFAEAELTPLAPVPAPRQIFCTGANYRRHVIDMVVALGASPRTDGMSDAEKHTWATELVATQRESGKPFIFMKPTSTVAGPHGEVAIPYGVTKMDWELELGVVLAPPRRGQETASAEDLIAGYMIVNDLTARDRMARPDAPGLGADWLSGKGAPGFLPCGPFIMPRRFVPDPSRLRMRLRVNGELKQDDDPGDMIYSIPRQVEYLSARVGLFPGDILCTGSPTGNGVIIGQFLRPGDVIEAEIDGLGLQRTTCIIADNHNEGSKW